MRAKSAKRLEAEQLRQEEGLSYAEISAKTGVSKSTLSSWLRDVELSVAQEQRLQERLWGNRAGFAARALSINRNRFAQARAQAYQGGMDCVHDLPLHASINELALAMLYLGEGSKSGNRVQLASTNVEIVCYFVDALVHLYHVDRSRLSARLNLVGAAHSLEQELVTWWSARLEIPAHRFTKTQYDPRSTATTVTADYHGVCTVTLGSSYLQQRLAGIAETYIRSKFS